MNLVHFILKKSYISSRILLDTFKLPDLLMLKRDMGGGEGEGEPGDGSKPNTCSIKKKKKRDPVPCRTMGVKLLLISLHKLFSLYLCINY